MARKIAKCPQCLPDVKGAIFKSESNADFTGSEWVCCNCHYRMPRRINKPTPKITPSQQRVINRLKSYGWEVETSLIGRKVWLKLNHKGKNLFTGDSAFGTIGPRGDVNITLQRFGGDKKVENFSDIYVYMS